ncbi:hypothetical protein UCRPC4_g00640 [Phaeomoniella chlamydospora]|uniref:Uncharacterized protein n=1 Tax=Phaeomoniella chlamydospora TaxID=158046 RepID=A0A0G2F1U7_PHACM|nr:hypothetical protein UCRPC4_g00640 [Phaeomoniella chlamydospora]
MLGFLKLSTLFLQETSTSSIHSKAPFKQSCQHFLDNMALEYNILISSLGQLLQETLFQFHREGLRHSELFLPELYRQSSSTSTSNNLPSKTSPQTQPLFHRLSSPDLTHQVQIITHTLVEKLTALIADAKYAQRHTYARQLEDPIKAVLCITDKEVGKGAKGQEKAIDLANKLVEWNCLPNIVEVENAVVGGVRVFV